MNSNEAAGAGTGFKGRFRTGSALYVARAEKELRGTLQLLQTSSSTKSYTLVARAQAVPRRHCALDMARRTTHTTRARPPPVRPLSARLA